MQPSRSGSYWRAVLARARRAVLLSGPRWASDGSGYAQDPLAGAGELPGELDRFGGVSVRLARLDTLDRLDPAAFKRALQGKCGWTEAPRAPEPFC
ncbi:hypothetical protein CB1_001273001 [Camelus ferus]|nr:hypothetical protein CB1_001273001 [Camelus ferus]